MPIIRQLDQLSDALRGGAVAIGNFDGVHLGHQAIVARLLERARELGGAALIFTFDPHPVRLLRPAQCPPPLTWTERKAELLARLGVNKVIAYPTDRRLLEATPAEFFHRYVREALDARAVVEGPNFFFGHNRAGDVRLLGELTRSAGMTLDVVEPQFVDGQLVSSSRIRGLVAAGEAALARRMLGAPYRLRGMVTHGAGRGATIGFPTANVEAIDTLLPGQGVYATRAWLGGESYAAATNIGPNPTFGDGAVKVEAHLVERREPLYGRALELEFLTKLRDVQTFVSADKLIEQLHRDVAAVRTIVAEESPLRSASL